MAPAGVQIGRGVVRRGGKDVALVAYGTMANNALAAAEMLAKSGVTATVADMRSASWHPCHGPQWPKESAGCREHESDKEKSGAHNFARIRSYQLPCLGIPSGVGGV